MKPRVILIAIFLVAAITTSEAAKYAGEPFALGAGARPLGLGGAFLSLADDPSAIYYNPAGLSRSGKSQILLLHSETFGSLLNHDFIAYSRPSRIVGRSGALGVGLYRVGGGGIIFTDKDSEGRPRILSEESHNDFLLLLGGGISLSEKMRVGTSARIIYRSLKDNNAFGLGLDAGLQYGDSAGLGWGAAISNLTTSFVSYTNGTKETILPVVKLGASYVIVHRQFLLRMAGDGDLLFENRDEAAQVSLGTVSIDTHFGGEFSYQEALFLRAGSNAGKLTLGVGFGVNRFRLDGAWQHDDNLDESYRFSLNITL